MTSKKIDDLDIDLLLALNALLDSQNVTQAARKLGITQPALSARLGRLRALFDDRLFVAGAAGRGVVPTPRALELKPLVADLVERLRALMATAPTFDPAQSKRTFVIAARENPATMMAPALVPLVRSQAPRVRLAFVQPHVDRIFSDLESGKADVFIGATHGTGRDALISRTLFEDDFLTAQRRGHPRGTGPLSLKEFCKLEHLLVAIDGSFSGLVDDALARKGYTRNVVVSVQNYALAPIIVANSDIVCTLPRRLIEPLSNVLHTVPPPIDVQRVELAAYWHERSQLDPGHKWLRDQIFAIARANK
ncbi:LysR family transcriptional regulator [Pendulispora brunnea]|uniref:LysR family transcriptional regulator n=1 Tax=Pendulispora brunnea TaxID=2905690 RepID=A0ABZ2JY76_9BACT